MRMSDKRNNKSSEGQEPGLSVVGDSHRQFVRDTWLSLASRAWEGYKKKGRGAMYVFCESETVVKDKTALIAHYVAETEPLLTRSDGALDDEIVKSIRVYHPEREVVVWFKWPDGQAVYVMPSRFVTPEEAQRILENNRLINDEKTHSRVIKERWLAIAAFSWENYQSEGRGAVVVDVENSDLAQSSRFFSVYYLVAGQNPQATVRKRFITANFAKEDDDFLIAFEESIATYTPERDVIVIFADPHGSIQFYTIDSQPSPPEVHELRQKSPPRNSSSN